MPEEKNATTTEELQEMRDETVRNLQHATRVLAEISEMQKKSEEMHRERMDEYDRDRQERIAEFDENHKKRMAKFDEVHQERIAEFDEDHKKRMAKYDKDRKKWIAEHDKDQAKRMAEYKQRREEEQSETAARDADFYARVNSFIEMTEKGRKRMEVINQASERNSKVIGSFGNKFGAYTEAMAEPSIRRILLESFGADFRRRLAVDMPEKGVAMEVDAWGVSRNGTKAVYLVEVKSRFKPKHIKQVLRHVEQFRKCFEQYRNREVYPVLAAVQISDRNRRRLWEAGVYLIDIADGVFSLAKAPSHFRPNGHHGLEGVRKDVPPLHLVWNANSDQRKAN